MKCGTLFLTIILILVATSAPGAMEIELPVLYQIRSNSVEIEADGATILISCIGEGEPSLRVRANKPDVTGSVHLAVAESAAVLVIAPVEEAIRPQRITFELALPQDFPVTLTGTDLVVHRSCEPEADELPDAFASGKVETPSTLKIEPNQSSVVFSGPGRAHFGGRNSEFSLKGTEGDLVFSSIDGSVHIDGHQGNLDLRVSNVAVAVADLEGNVTASLSRGSLSISGSKGGVGFTADESSLDISEHQGRIKASGSSNDIVIHQTTAPMFNVSGEDNRITINGGSGGGSTTLAGGTLDLEDWTGRFTLTARSDTEFDIQGVEGDVGINLTDGASGALRGVTGHTKVRVENGNVEVADLKSIELVASSSFVVASEIPELIRCEINDGEFSFTSSVMRGTPKIQLALSARATVEIPIPCRVHLLGPGRESLLNEIRGCDARRGNSPTSQMRKSKWETERPINLTVQLSADAQITVDGRMP